MTIADLLERIGWAFERTFYLVIGGEFGDLVLSDLGIIALIVVVSFPFLFVVGLFVVDIVQQVESLLEREMTDNAYLAQRRSEEESQRPWGYGCNQCGCLFDRDPAGADECPDCGSDDLSRHVFKPPGPGRGRSGAPGATRRPSDDLTYPPGADPHQRRSTGDLY